ncbi:glutamate receptor delta-2 subunit-like, partial [Tropilaelaps mercedesae]
YTLRNSGSWGLRLENGSFNGAIGQLDRNEADLALACLRPTYDSFGVIPFSPLIHPIEVAILAARKTRFLKTPFALVNGFSLEVWLLLILATLALAVGMSLVHRLFIQPSGFMKLLDFYVFQLFGNTWNECTSQPPPFNTLRIVWMSWLLAVTMILMNAFAGNLKVALEIN